MQPVRSGGAQARPAPTAGPTAERRYRALLEALAEPVFVADVETGRCLDANAAAVAASGLSRSVLLGGSLLERAAPAERARLVNGLRELTPGRPLREMVHLVGPQGREAAYELWVRLVDSTLERAAVMTARPLAGQRGNADRAGWIAHAVNNPLSALIGTVQMGIEAGAPTVARLERLLHLGHRIGSIVDRMLQLSRQGPLELGEVDPAKLLSELEAEHRERAGESCIRTILRLPPTGLPSLRADRALLRTALEGVVLNSIEAMPEGGDLFLEAESDGQGRAILFRISDSGPGVSEEVRGRVFEPFVTTKGTGAGLGLAITRDAVLRHGGHVDLATATGGGTVVTLEIPLEGD